ncbi:GNAT family N-acetyltransferase [Falsiroseomonas oryziterrae]|uniref:GNAT family N-acetyltransferase n=1 Tax=Falsiroseomonas oryziterrae TaxID=2911368 RepID=UPI001F3B13C7|nr:GNAT family N-acetyltransferase [Roseomonas sp. NPKOSM-4]
MSLRILPLEARHRADWERLYAGYAAFYRVTQTPEMRARVWDWIMDPVHEVKALVAEDAAGRLLGLAHFRPFARPLSATVGGFLDDLFVDPAARGQRVADALIEAVAEEGRQRGWSVIRWITADDNYRGRGVYDRLATRTMWITYDKKLP